MAWFAVDKNGEEWVYESKPVRHPRKDVWITDKRLNPLFNQAIRIRRGSIKNLLNRELTWEDKPVEQISI